MIKFHPESDKAKAGLGVRPNPNWISTGFRLQSVGFRPQSVRFQPQSVEFRSQSAEFSLASTAIDGASEWNSDRCQPQFGRQPITVRPFSTCANEMHSNWECTVTPLTRSMMVGFRSRSNQTLSLAAIRLKFDWNWTTPTFLRVQKMDYSVIRRWHRKNWMSIDAETLCRAWSHTGASHSLIKFRLKFDQHIMWYIVLY